MSYLLDILSTLGGGVSLINSPDFRGGKQVYIICLEKVLLFLSLRNNTKDQKFLGNFIIFCLRADLSVIQHPEECRFYSKNLTYLNTEILSF